MQSSGGVVDVETAATAAAGCVLSGPAGGVVGAAHVAGASGYEDVLTFDMGGTRTDVAPVARRRGAARRPRSVVAGVPIKLPTVDVHTVQRRRRLDRAGSTRAGRCASARARRRRSRPGGLRARAARSRR